MEFLLVFVMTFNAGTMPPGAIRAEANMKAEIVFEDHAVCMNFLNSTQATIQQQGNTVEVLSACDPAEAVGIFGVE